MSCRGTLANNEKRPFGEPPNYILPVNICGAATLVLSIQLYPSFYISVDNTDKVFQHFSPVLETQVLSVVAKLVLQIRHCYEIILFNHALNHVILVDRKDGLTDSLSNVQ